MKDVLFRGAMGVQNYNYVLRWNVPSHAEYLFGSQTRKFSVPNATQARKIVAIFTLTQSRSELFNL